MTCSEQHNQHLIINLEIYYLFNHNKWLLIIMCFALLYPPASNQTM
jgi:hypothetical protein